MGAVLESPRGSHAHAGHRCGDFLGVMFALVHKEADLLVRDVGSGHGCSLLLEGNQPS
nr:hypothetical protein [Burkholderia ubonensis]